MLSPSKTSAGKTVASPSNLLTKKSRHNFFGSIFTRLALGRGAKKHKRDKDESNDGVGGTIPFSDMDMKPARSQVPSNITLPMGTFNASFADNPDPQVASKHPSLADADVIDMDPEEEAVVEALIPAIPFRKSKIIYELKKPDESERDSDDIKQGNILPPSSSQAIEITLPKPQSSVWEETKSTVSDGTSSVVDNISVPTEDVHKPDLLARKAYYLRGDEQENASAEQFEVVQRLNTRSNSISSEVVSTVEMATSPSKKPKRYDTIKTHVITNRTFSRTNWNVGYESLTIRDCATPIDPIYLTNSTKSLLSLKFAKLTSVPNLITFLKHCRKLRKLTFANVTLVNKKTPTQGEIKLLNLLELEITEWLFCLTRHDYWLLEFFVKYVKSPNLSSFTFRGTDNFLSTRIAQNCANALKEVNSASAVITFMLKHQKTLDKLSVGGLGFRMMDSDEIIQYPELSNLNALTHIRVTLNAEGIDQLLKAQTMLQSLTCYGFVSNFATATKQMLVACIEKNSATLRTIGIFPCILLEKVRKPGQSHANQAYTFHCEVFQRCKNLNTLFMNVTLASSVSTQRLSCGKVYNLPLLPTTFSTLEIYTHEFQPAELEAFGKKFPRFLNLRRLVLSSDKSHPYFIRIWWIRSLFALPHFISGDFFGGKLDNVAVFQDYVFSKPRGFMSMVKVADCVSFYRSAHYEPSVKWSEMGGKDLGRGPLPSSTVAKPAKHQQLSKQQQSKSRIIRSNYQF